MELIERVARGMARGNWTLTTASGMEDRSEDEHYAAAASYYLRLAKAAIRAMLDGVEPVAWVYWPMDGEPEDAEFETAKPSKRPAGYSEAALYSLDALKEAL